MPNFIAGPGQTLPFPTGLYPGFPAISDVPAGGRSTNFFDLAPGATFNIAAGQWSVYIGAECTLQIYDPVMLAWVAYNNTHDYSQSIRSDGVNWRVANLTGCAVGAVITNAGSGYTSAPTVSASAGGSTWTAVVGGAVSTSVTITSAGSGYTVPPILVIPAPAAGGVPATAYAVITAGAITSVVVTNQGAGYTSVPPIGVIPSFQDPNIGSITAAVLTATLTGSGEVTAVICNFNGSSVGTPPTLSFAGGGGTGAAATATVLNTITAITVTSGGAGYPNAVAALTIGGGVAPGSPVFTNPRTESAIAYPPTPAVIELTASGGVIQSSGITVYQSGLFVGTPIIQAIGGSTDATFTVTLGGGHSVFYLQPL